MKVNRMTKNQYRLVDATPGRCSCPGNPGPGGSTYGGAEAPSGWVCKASKRSVVPVLVTGFTLSILFLVLLSPVNLALSQRGVRLGRW